MIVCLVFVVRGVKKQHDRINFVVICGACERRAPYLTVDSPTAIVNSALMKS